MATQAQIDQLREALQAYQTLASPFYDEAVDEIAARARVTGSLGKADFGGLVAWKRLNGSTRWMSEFMATPPTHSSRKQHETLATQPSMTPSMYPPLPSSTIRSLASRWIQDRRCPRVGRDLRTGT